jgi:hypothetical protein
MHGGPWNGWADVYTLRYTIFEEVMNNEPLDVGYEEIDGEERYRSVGVTNRGRLLSVVWTLREDKVRAVTAFPASVLARKMYLERLQ